MYKRRNMRRDRSQALVIRENKILLVKHIMNGRTFYCMPGGGIDTGETPEEAALRELAEESNVSGRIVRKLSVQYKPDNRGEVHTFLVELNEDSPEPTPGVDPENEEQTIIGVAWKALNEISEIDRMYLWSSGLNRVEAFHKEALGWSDEISYPNYR